MNDEISQIKVILGESRNPLIILSQNPSHDAIASGLALYSLCEKLNKKATIMSHDFTPSRHIYFLSRINHISKNIENLKNFVISLDVSKTKIDNLEYHIKDNELKIFLAPKEGELNAEDLKFDTPKFKHDIIFTIDAENLESLGAIYEKNLDFFYQTTIVNIDHKPQNTRFGQINLVDLSSTAVSEIIFKMFENEIHLVDEDIATHFLTGIISKTKSFRNENITPRTLEIAGRLISMGAKREEIVNNLYKQQTVPILKLWGRALAGLKHDERIGLVWSVLTRQDFVKAGADCKHLPDVIDELIENSPEAKITLLIYENADSICCLIRAGKNFDLNSVAMRFNATLINNEMRFCINDKDLLNSEKWILEEIKKALT
ncbi:MAG: hypothetical protein HQ536_04265 [Parcubacteria group bacterium]|nr:hypothetical protein [Parcubacteria group bacterium]